MKTSLRVTAQQVAMLNFTAFTDFSTSWMKHKWSAVIYLKESQQMQKLMAAMAAAPIWFNFTT